MENKKLTEKSEIGSVTDDALIHIVEPNDLSQGPSGSSYKFKIKNLILAGQDNIDIKKYVTILSTDTITQIVDKINLLAPYTVDEKQSVWFVTRQKGTMPYTPQRVLKYKMMNKGKGTYGAGEIQLAVSDLELVYTNVESTADLEEDPTTDIINIGDIPDMPISEWLNFQDPAIVIQSQEDGYTIFQGTIEGEAVTYLWIGEPGVYGVDETQSSEADFQLMSNSLPPVGVLTVTGNAVNNDDPANPKINIGDGLRYIDGVVKFGSPKESISPDGFITEDTWVIRTNSLVDGYIVDAYENDINHDEEIGSLYREIKTEHFDSGQNARFFERTGYLDGNVHSIVGIELNLPGGNTGISIDTANERMLINDENWSKGLEYADDYSAENTDNPRWVPDKEYVDGAISGQVLNRWKKITVTPEQATAGEIQDDDFIGATMDYIISSLFGTQLEVDFDSETGTITRYSEENEIIIPHYTK